MKTRLACPECFGGSPLNCERCDATGYISVVVPGEGVPDDMRELLEPERDGLSWLVYLAIGSAAAATLTGLIAGTYFAG